jgi:uncharacterized protein DUF5999
VRGTPTAIGSDGPGGRRRRYFAERSLCWNIAAPSIPRNEMVVASRQSGTGQTGAPDRRTSPTQPIFPPFGHHPRVGSRPPAGPLQHRHPQPDQAIITPDWDRGNGAGRQRSQRPPGCWPRALRPQADCRMKDVVQPARTSPLRVSKSVCKSVFTRGRARSHGGGWVGRIGPSRDLANGSEARCVMTRTCSHTPRCPAADSVDACGAHVECCCAEQGWCLLCNGVILFDDGGLILPTGTCLEPGHQLAASRAA